jgi:hypothetical protein
VGKASAIDALIAKARANGNAVTVYGVQMPTAPAEPVSEKQFQAAVVKEAKRLGWRVYHTYDSRKSEAGFVDLVLLRGPRKMVAELKVGSNKPSAAQLNWLEWFADAGVESHVWYPTDWPKIMERLA